MKQLLTLSFLTLFVFSRCNNKEENETNTAKTITAKKQTSSAAATTHWKGSFSNGMKGAKISFDVNGTELQSLTFQGYWRCDGKLELTTLGPEESFLIEEGQVDGVIVEPKNGPAPFRFELHGMLKGNKAEGTLRISNVAAGCDTYKLNWTAEKE